MAYTICVLNGDENAQEHNCKKHRHVKMLTAREWNKSGMAQWMGPKHIRMTTASWKIVRTGPYGLGYTQLVMEQ